MKTYPTQAELRERFDYKDGDLIYKFDFGPRATSGNVAGTNKRDYKFIGINGRNYITQRLIWIWHNKDIPEGMEIDFINRLKHDTRIENIRLATHSQNLGNVTKYKTNSSNYKGVCYNKKAKCWHAYICINQKQKHLGVRDTPEAAHELYIAAAKELYGEFACTE